MKYFIIGFFVLAVLIGIGVSNTQRNMDKAGDAYSRALERNMDKAGDAYARAIENNARKTQDALDRAMNR